MSVRKEQLSKDWTRHAEQYLAYLDRQQVAPDAGITTAALAQAIGSAEKDVRLELAAITDSGQLRAGYPYAFLKQALEAALGYYNLSDIVLLGSGKLADDLLANESFAARGFRIAAAFAVNPPDGRFRPYSELSGYCRSRHIHLGIIATPPAQAAEACRRLLAGGVLGVWNVSGAMLESPPDSVAEVENERFGEHEEVRDNPYVSLSIRAIARQLADRLGWSIDFNIDGA